VSSRRKLQREVRKGKAVYLPIPARAERSPKTTQGSSHRLSRTGTDRSHHRRSKAGVHLARLLVLAALGAIAASIWLTIQYLINPDVAFWLDSYLPSKPSARRLNADLPQTLSQLQRAIEKEGLIAGQPVVLKNNFVLTQEIKTADNIAIPVFAKDPSSNCSDPCQAMSQLRLYRSLQLPFLIRFFQADPHFRLTDKIAVRGPSSGDLQVLDQNPQLSTGSAQSLPITQLAVYDLAPQPGLWLRLIGLRNQGSSISTYGQVFYFNPFRERLDLMTNWVSPPGEVPQWQQVTDNNTLPELVINQTVGAEPQYAVYQLQMVNGAAHQLQPITLTEPAFLNDAYTDALTLARSGLWTPALTHLKQVKQDNPKQWNGLAQAQLDYIQLHARITQAQAEQPSASSIQRILGYLVNGSWSPALDVLQSDRAVRPELREMLLSDSGRLANRINTALKITPGDTSIIAWGAMLRLISSSEAQAIAWTQQQSHGNPATLAKVKPLLKQLDRPETLPVEPKASAKASKPTQSKEKTDSQPNSAQPSPTP
jgi:hypothetical protein